MEKALLFVLLALSLLAKISVAETISVADTASAADRMDSNYTLGSGDLIRIQVYGESDLTLEARLTDAGTISYPFIGQIKVTGLTLKQLQDRIAEGLQGDYLVNPRVSVTILDYRQFFINGEVKKPGGFSYQPGLTIRKAVSVAGGFTERASKDKIFVISEADPDKQKRVDLNALVRPGDIITVEQSFF